MNQLTVFRVAGSAHGVAVVGGEGLCSAVQAVHPALQGQEQNARQVCRSVP